MEMDIVSQLELRTGFLFAISAHWSSSRKSSDKWEKI